MWLLAQTSRPNLRIQKLRLLRVAEGKKIKPLVTLLWTSTGLNIQQGMKRMKKNYLVG